MNGFQLLFVLIYSKSTFSDTNTEIHDELGEDDYSPDYHYADDELPFLDEFDEIEYPRAKEAVIKNKDALIHENQYPFIVGIVSDTYTFHCFGLLVTATDVLTTYSCIVKIYRTTKSVKLVRVIAKTPVVRWLRTPNAVWNLNGPRTCRVLQSCEDSGCRRIKRYHDIVLLTTEYFEIWYGYVETIPRAFISNRRWYDQSFTGCFISGVVFSTPSFVLLKKVNFTIIQVLSTTAHNFTMPMLVGRAAENDYGSLVPGGALMCYYRERFVPVGIYAGHVRHTPGTMQNILKTNLSDPCYNPMKDVIKHLDYEPWTNESDPDRVFGVALVFQNVYDWVDINTYELKEQSSTVIELSSGSRLMPGLIVVFALLTKELFISEIKPL